MAPSERIYQFGPFLLNAAERVLLREGRRVPLPPKVFETLLTLVEQAGHVVQKETIIKRVWPDTYVQEDSLTFNISTLRKALGGHTGGQQFIETEHKVGYRFVAPVKILEAGSGGTGVLSHTIIANEQPGRDPLTRLRAEADSMPGASVALRRAEARPAPAEESAGGGPPSPPRGRGEDLGWGRAGGFESRGGKALESGRGEDSRVGSWQDVARGRGEDVQGGTSAGSEAAPQRARRGMKWGGLGLALLIVAAAAVWLALPPPQPKLLKSDQITADGREKGVGLATDGDRIYFIEEASTGWVIAQVSAYGGEPVPIAKTPKDSTITGISLDHRELLVVEGREFGPGTVRVVPVLDGEPRRLGNLRAYWASWSPDGGTLAYTSDGGVYLSSPDGSNPRQIVNLSGLLVDLYWSPNGGKLCFIRGEHSQVSLWEVDRDGKGLRCLSSGLLSGLDPKHGFWTPNGEYLITRSPCAGHWMPIAVRFSSLPFGRHWEQSACLESGPLEIAVTAISPDGARLFGLANAASHPQMEEYDTHSHQFKPFLPSISCGYADFSRDGQRIACVTGEKDINGASSLWVSQIDGSHKVQITKPPLLTQLPRWSPDGKWIAFMGKEPEQPWRVRVVSADGGSYAPVTPVNDEEGAPTWSPDRGQVAFGGMTRLPTRTRGPLAIHILNLKTGQLSQVPGSEGLWTARWSPDGRYIAAVTEDNCNLKLFDFHSKRWVKLATMGAILDVSWSRHEEAIYFNGKLPGEERAIFRVKIPGGRLERLASLSGRTEWDWLGLTPDDSPLIASHIQTSEIYALTVKWP